VVLIYTLMQTPVCIYKHNCFSIWRSREEELNGGQQSFYCFHSQDVGYIACQRRRRRFWIRPGRTVVWWENFEKEVVLPDEWHENFKNVALITTVSFGVTASLHRRAYLCGFM